MADSLVENFGAATLPLASTDIFPVIQGASPAKQTTLGAMNPDTGWINLSGFAFMPTPPQYRVIGRTLHFRGSMLIPLSSDGGPTLIAYVNEASYLNQFFVAPFTGAGGVTVATTGGITFNLGAPVIPTAAHFPDNTYQKVGGVMLRRINSSLAGNEILYSAWTNAISISAAGILTISTLMDVEELTAAAALGHSPLRFATSNVVSGDFALDFRNTGGGDTLHGKTAAAPLTYAIVEQAFTHSVTLDAALAQNLGGFAITLDGFTAQLAPL